MKGISPLIATVILVAFVIAIGSIASQFFLDFTREEADIVEEAGEESINCGTAAIRIHPDKVSWSSSNSELILTIENKGQTDLEIPNLIWFNSNDIGTNVVPTDKSTNTEIDSSNKIDSGKLKTINASVAESPTKITITTSCAGKTSTVQNDTSTNNFKTVF